MPTVPLLSWLLAQDLGFSREYRSPAYVTSTQTWLLLAGAEAYPSQPTTSPSLPASQWLLQLCPERPTLDLALTLTSGSSGLAGQFHNSPTRPAPSPRFWMCWLVLLLCST